MSYFLIVYDRPSGKQLDLKEFSSREEATHERFEREIAELGHSGVEVVVLGASSLEKLKKTHSRYFKSLEQLAAG
jgi:hypothetical protein